MKRIALVVPGFEEDGGVPAVARFLAHVLRESGRYEPSFISLPMSSKDPSSLRLLSPSSWLRGLRCEQSEWRGETFTHVGAFVSEFEFQRYRPRRALTELMASFDLVQIVAGAPAWGWIARDLTIPTGMQVATLVATERLGLPSVGDPVSRGWRSLMTRVTTRLESHGLACVDAVFVENEWMNDFLRSSIGSERVIFAPPGVDTKLFCPAEEAPPVEAPGVIICVGRLGDPRKRVDLLFDAYARLSDRLEDPPRLLLAGFSAPSEANWVKARTLGVAERIEFRADVSRQELVDLYRSASISVLSSDEEGLGIVIVEAMACGLPVVSTDCGGPSTSIVHGETGMLVPCDDAEALASAMHALMVDPEKRARMSRRARTRSVEVFSLEASARPFLDWYDRALADPIAS